MSFITKTLRYLIVINSLISIGYAAHHFPFRASINGMNGAVKHAVSSTVTPRFAKATHPMAMGMLAKNHSLFKVLCSRVFMQPVPTEVAGTLWIPYRYDPRNTFLQFETPPASIDLQITSGNIWSDTSMVNTTPKSDTGQSSIVYNLITDPRNKIDRSFMFTSARKIVNPSVVYVTQMGLGADCLQQSSDPETKAWVNFLTSAHKQTDIPTNTPDNVAAAYTAIELSHWPTEVQAHYHTSLNQKIPLTSMELEQLVGIIDYCLDQSYPLATMVKYTGLSAEEIIRIVTLLKNEQ